MWAIAPADLPLFSLFLSTLRLMQDRPLTSAQNKSQPLRDAQVFIYTHITRNLCDHEQPPPRMHLPTTLISMLCGCTYTLRLHGSFLHRIFDHVHALGGDDHSIAPAVLHLTSYHDAMWCACCDSMMLFAFMRACNAHCIYTV